MLLIDKGHNISVTVSEILPRLLTNLQLSKVI